MSVEKYFDYNATTPVDPRVLAEMLPFFSERFHNPSSFYRDAGKVSFEVQKAREHTARLIGASPLEIVFTSGGTEADNLAIQGVAHQRGGKGRHLITSAIEHSAVLETFRHLSQDGFEITVLPVDRSGLVDPATLQKAMRKETALVSIMHANNEIGTIQPIAELAGITHHGGALFHTDAVQSAGKIPIAVQEMGVDLLSLSAHKMYGPKGAGALYVRKHLKLESLLWGGGQEKERRAGTENVPGIVGLGKACELALQEMGEEAGRLVCLRDQLQDTLLAKIPSAWINGDTPLRLPNTLNITIRDCDSAAMLAYLDHDGLALSAGSACSAHAAGPSHVLLAIGLDPEDARSSLRISLGCFSREEGLDPLVEAVGRVAMLLRGSASGLS